MEWIMAEDGKGVNTRYPSILYPGVALGWYTSPLRGFSDRLRLGDRYKSVLATVFHLVMLVTELLQ